MKQLFLSFFLFISFSSVFAADVLWNSRLEGSSVEGGYISMEDGDANLAANSFVDVESKTQSYLRLGLTERMAMSFVGADTKVNLSIRITTFIDGLAQSPSTINMEVIYSHDGNGITVDAEDYRMLGIYKFTAEVLSVSATKRSGNTWINTTIPSFLFLEAGFNAERYYTFDHISVPVINSSFITFDPITSEMVQHTPNSNAVTTILSNTYEIELSWNYIAGAENYELEWTWVDNYDKIAEDILFTEQDFARNCTRVRLGAQTYRLPHIFSKGYLIYRVRGVGRFSENVSKEKYGAWSSVTSSDKASVNDWVNFIVINIEHEPLKNWQYQSTYAEDGKKKEVVQYFDGKLLNRQTVTRINSSNQTVVGETIYDNEGRGVIQVLPVPQENPLFMYYKNFNLNPAGQPYNYENFDVEPITSGTSCEVAESHSLKKTSGAGLYYSTDGHVNDSDWQKNVPDAVGYPFTQVEYTPDNTGRIRNQSGVGNEHKIGSEHETYYYYLQPAQEELNRLFGYKVGYKQRYKKNMVVDANGQVSVSYLDAQGRVVATSLVGDNFTPMATLASAPMQGELTTDLLNKLVQDDEDRITDENELDQTNRFGSEKDILRMSTQIGVPQTLNYKFEYEAKSGVYTAGACPGSGVQTTYPYVYDLKISIKDDCGTELFTQVREKLGVEQINGAAGDIINEATTGDGIELKKGSYTVLKELKVNKEAYENYLSHFLSSDGNPCLFDQNSFSTEVDANCDYSCETCLADLGTQSEFIEMIIKDEIGPDAVYADLDADKQQLLITLYEEAKDACVRPCTPISSCDAYSKMLLGDLQPGGQYSTWIVSSDISIHPEYKLYQYVEQICNTTFAVPTTPSSPLSTINLSSESFDSYLRDNIFTFEQASGKSNDLYYEDGGNYDFYGINFFPPNTYRPFVSIDPYFNIDYTSIHLLTDVGGSMNDIDNTTRKGSLMNNAIGNYKDSQMSLYQYSVRAVLSGYDVSMPIDPQYDTWPEFVSIGFAELANPGSQVLTIGQIDAIFNNVKSFYLSEKSRINQLLMDMYGFYQQPAIYNGAIGDGVLEIGIAASFSQPSIHTDIHSLWWGWGFGNNFINIPSAFCGVEYDDMEARIPRVDAVTGSSSTVVAQIQALTDQANYAMWQSTGQCPTTLGLESLLNELAQKDELNDQLDLSWNEVITLTPNLLETIASLTMTQAQGQNIRVKGEMMGNDLAIKITSSLGDFCIGTFPPISSNLPWSTCGTQWKIYSIANSFASSMNTVSVLVKAGTSPSDIHEYVVTYSSCKPVNGCQTEYAKDNSQDANCEKRQVFQTAMQQLLQQLVSDGTIATTLALNTMTQYTGTILKDYFGNDASWDGATATITNSTLNLSFGFGSLLPSDISLVNGFDIIGDTIYVQYFTNTNNTGAIINKAGVYSFVKNGKAYELNFNCMCVELDGEVLSGDIEAGYDVKVDALINHLLGLASQNALPTGAYTCIETEELGPYMGRDVFIKIPPIYSIYTYSSGGITYNYPSMGIGQNPTLGFDIFEKVTEKPLCNISIGGFLNDLGKFKIPGSSYEDGKNSCRFENFCDECPPAAQAPISCNDAYSTYSDYMKLHMSQGVDEGINIMEESHFCDLNYAYISTAYIYYLQSMFVGNTTDLLYLTLSEFGNTPIGYSNAILQTAVDAFANYVDDNQTDFLLWNEWMNEIYAATRKLCPVISPPPVYPTIPPFIAPCNLWEQNISTVNAQNQFGIYLNQVAESFRHNYITGAMNSVVETFTESHLDKEYHYTLYYYDRAGNLTQTVPPKGVDRLQLNTAQNTFINNFRADNPEETAEETADPQDIIAPNHTLTTDYRYNSLNQLVYQITPDGGESRFAYDDLGRLVVSQNAKQQDHQPEQYSYTLYDELGRVEEVGQFEQTLDLLIDEFGKLIYKPTTIGQSTVPFDVNNYHWLDRSPDLDDVDYARFSRTEVTRTKYDELAGMTVPVSSSAVMAANTQFGAEYKQFNTRNRIVAVVYQTIYDADISHYENASFYNYDVHGNVIQLLQVNNDPNLVALGQNSKLFDYQYDLVSGNVNKVYYQKGKLDQYIHRYSYDSDNRITHAETSKDDFVFEKDAKYYYYDHGPLARTEIGDKKVQAQDYAYTIQGWLKTVNGEQVNEETMLGKDGDVSGTGSVTNLNKTIARDAYGYSLSYFDKDYIAADMTMLNNSETSTNLGSGLYNGNIRSMYTALSNLEENINPTTAILTHQSIYGYDQLNRILKMDGFIINSDGIMGTSGYNSTYSYDANGNLKTLTRQAKTDLGQVKQMDDFHYHYLAGSNKLEFVSDIAVSGNYPTDVDNQSVGNYDYDAIGQLIYDESEAIANIEWTVTNKVKRVVYGTRTANPLVITPNGKEVEFDYDAMGHRIAKHFTDAGSTKSTYYVLDAQGNTMCNYTYDTKVGDSQNKLYLSERNIYGSSRVGIEQISIEMNPEAISDKYVYPFDQVKITDVNCGDAGTILCSSVVHAENDYNADGNTDFVVNYSLGADDPSIHLMIDVVEGQTYTLEFDILASNRPMKAYIVDCPTAAASWGTPLDCGTPGSYSHTFTATSASNKMRVKWETGESFATAAGTYIMSNLRITRFQHDDPFGLNVKETIVEYNQEIGDKRYELANHLGNVLNVITDRKLGIDDGTYDMAFGTKLNDTPDGILDFYTADVVSYSDYYPFGMTMPNRHGSENESYRYAFNGKEQDPEVSGEGNIYDYGFRIYNPRIGKFLSVDPLCKSYPWYTPYQFAGNMPIWAIDVDGLEEKKVTVTGTNHLIIKVTYIENGAKDRKVDYDINGVVVKSNSGFSYYSAENDILHDCIDQTVFKEATPACMSFEYAYENKPELKDGAIDYTSHVKEIDVNLSPQILYYEGSKYGMEETSNQMANENSIIYGKVTSESSSSEESAIQNSVNNLLEVSSLSLNVKATFNKDGSADVASKQAEAIKTKMIAYASSKPNITAEDVKNLEKRITVLNNGKETPQATNKTIITIQAPDAKNVPK